MWTIKRSMVIKEFLCFVWDFRWEIPIHLGSDERIDGTYSWDSPFGCTGKNGFIEHSSEPIPGVPLSVKRQSVIDIRVWTTNDFISVHSPIVRNVCCKSTGLSETTIGFELWDRHFEDSLALIDASINSRFRSEKRHTIRWNCCMFNNIEHLDYTATYLTVRQTIKLNRAMQFILKWAQRNI